MFVNLNTLLFSAWIAGECQLLQWGKVVQAGNLGEYEAKNQQSTSELTLFKYVMVCYFTIQVFPFRTKLFSAFS